MHRMRTGGTTGAAVVLVFATLGAAAPAAGQTQTGHGVWTGLSVQGRVGDDSPWRWTSESLVRARDGASTLDVVGGQVIVSRDLSRQSSAGAGYAYFTGFTDSGSVREHRFVQQYAWAGGTTPRLSLRSRVEERFVSGQEAVQIRVRQQVRVVWPLVGGRLHGVVSEELFVRATSTARVPGGFDRNHVFIGIGRTLTPRSQMEVGYLNVHVRGASKASRRTHVMSATLGVSL